MPRRRFAHDLFTAKELGVPRTNEFVKAKRQVPLNVDVVFFHCKSPLKTIWRASDSSYSGLYKPPGTAAGLPAMPRRRASSLPSRGKSVLQNHPHNSQQRTRHHDPKQQILPPCLRTIPLGEAGRGGVRRSRRRWLLVPRFKIAAHAEASFLAFQSSFEIRLTCSMWSL